MPYAAFEAHLKKIGLSDKEAAVYIASLQLGPQTVQNLSRKSKVARATTYLVLESLMKKGLVTRYEASGKPTFIAEPPHQLERLIEDREKQLEKDKQELFALLPMLQAFMAEADDRPLVRYYEGLEGLRALRNLMTMYSKSKDVWYHYTPYDYMKNVFVEEKSLVYTDTRKAKGIQSKAIIATSSEEDKKRLQDTADKWSQRKFVDPKHYTSSSSMTLLEKQTTIGTFSGKIGGVMIESESITRMLRESFELLWNRLD